MKPSAPRLAPLALLALLAQLAGPACAQAGAPDLTQERRVKAAFLVRFIGYTEFPATAFLDPGAPVVIGLVDADALASELSRIVAGRGAAERPIAVKVLHDGADASGVHLLFIGGSDNARIRSVLKSAPQAPMLVVSEAQDALAQGSVINFRVVDERVRFDVSLEAAGRNSVKLSSRLLAVANHVQKGAP